MGGGGCCAVTGCPDLKQAFVNVGCVGVPIRVWVHSLLAAANYLELALWLPWHGLLIYVPFPQNTSQAPQMSGAESMRGSVYRFAFIAERSLDTHRVERFNDQMSGLIFCCCDLSMKSSGSVEPRHCLAAQGTWARDRDAWSAYVWNPAPGGPLWLQTISLKKSRHEILACLKKTEKVMCLPENAHRMQDLSKMLMLLTL